MPESERSNRRDFVTRAAAISTAAVGASFIPRVADAHVAEESPRSRDERQSSVWDLRWVQMIQKASDRALFDWPSLGDPADPTQLWFADRYAQNCESVYGAGKYSLALVLNIRTQAVPAALKDELWERYTLGAEYKVNDPHTSQPALRNPFWHEAPSIAEGIRTPSLSKFLPQGAIALVCDFALGHLSKRLASKHARAEQEIHDELLRGLVPGAFAVPSGMFGMAKAQNAGCALIKLA